MEFGKTPSRNSLPHFSLIDHIDPVYAKNIVHELVELGLHKVAGTEREHIAASFIKTEMIRLGLENVREESFPVYRRDPTIGGSVTILNQRFSAFPLASTRPSKRGGVRGILVYVDQGLARDYSVDVAGKIVLYRRCWTELSETGGFFRALPIVEAWSRGAAGVIVFDEQIPNDCTRIQVTLLGRMNNPVDIPIVTTSQRDAEIILSLCQMDKVEVVLESWIEEPTLSYSCNVLGIIPGNSWSEQQVILASHYDTWFHGAADSLSGIGCLLSMAKALIECNYHPKRTIVFLAHGAEEQGWPSWFDWLIGSHNNINKLHPDWAGRTLAELNIDILASSSANMEVECLPELLDPVRHGCKQAGLSDNPVFTQPAPSKTLPYIDSGAYIFAGVPSANITCCTPDYWAKYYHTPYDTMDLINEESLLWANKLWLTTTLILSDQPWAIDAKTAIQALGDQVRGQAARLCHAGLSDKKANAISQALSELEIKIAGREKQIAEANPLEIIELTRPLLDILKLINNKLRIIGGFFCIDMFYLAEPYVRDLITLEKTKTEVKAGCLKQAIESLEQLQALHDGRLLSEKAYRSYINQVWQGPELWAPAVQKYADSYTSWQMMQKDNPPILKILADLIAEESHVQAWLDEAYQTINEAILKAESLLR